MQKESWKVFLACAFGAGIGSLVALQLSHWFWWLGLLVGGLTGYLSYEWKRVVQAVPQAFRTATSWRSPNHAIVHGFWVGIIAWNIMFLLLLPFLIRTLIKPLDPLTLSSTRQIGALPWLILVPIAVAIICFFVPMLPDEFGRSYMEDVDWTKTLKRFAFNTFPLILLFWHLPRGLGRLVLLTPKLVRFCKRFAWQMFIRIHSEKRLICGVDAMLGAAIGYMAHHAIIGALAGGIIGLINHAIVTERWLKPRGYITVKS